MLKYDWNVWLLKILQKNWSNPLEFVLTSVFWAVMSLVRPTLYHFNFPNSSLTFAKSNQNSGLNLNRMLWPSWKLCFKNNVITFSLGKIYWFLTGLFGKMASTPMMPSMHKWLKCYVTNSMNIRGYKVKRHCFNSLFYNPSCNSAEIKINVFCWSWWYWWLRKKIYCNVLKGYHMNN